MINKIQAIESYLDSGRCQAYQVTYLLLLMSKGYMLTVLVGMDLGSH